MCFMAGNPSKIPFNQTVETNDFIILSMNAPTGYHTSAEFSSLHVPTIPCPMPHTLVTELPPCQCPTPQHTHHSYQTEAY